MKKIIFTLLLSLFSAGFLQAQENDNGKQDFKHYRFENGIDIFSFYYGYNFLQRKNWDLGVEASAGFGVRTVLFYMSRTVSPVKSEFTKHTGILGFNVEMVKINPYFRYYYYKNNFFNAGINFSAFTNGMLNRTNYDLFISKDNFPTLSTGFHFSIFYGPEQIKFGTGIQYDMLLRQRSEDNKHQTFLLLWTPFIIQFLF